jgi:N-acetylmuramic acid 6-phosphate etherase
LSEKAHPRADELSTLSTLELLEIMHTEDRHAVEAVHSSLGQIAGAIDEVATRLRQGGHLHYFGAGTSGQLAALDAAECPATFGVNPNMVQAHYVEDVSEDDQDKGRDAARQAGLGPRDAVVGVSAGGRTAFVIAALEVARASGALVVGLSCAPGSPLGAAADVAIEVETGPEVIAGSTRLKGGTVQKVILNMISTGVFTRLGHTYRGRMVDVVGANEKLRDRAARIVNDLSGAPRDQVDRALAEAQGSAKVAILMLRCGLAEKDARALLSSAAGDLTVALGEAQGLG